jgi:hypothetical protein
MAKKTITLQLVTREILKEEISASEQRLGAKIAGLDVKVDNVENRLDARIGYVETRLDAKIDNVEKRVNAKIDSRFNHLDAKIETTAQSLKEYTDSRFTRLDGKIGGVEKSLGKGIRDLDSKVTKYFELMMQTFMNSDKETHKLLAGYEERITVLEGRGLQPGRI